MADFTFVSPNLEATGPVIDVEVGCNAHLASALRVQGHRVPHAVRMRAMIDTGASASTISPWAVQQLGIEQFDAATVRTAHREGSQEIGLYKVDLTLFGHPGGPRTFPMHTVVGVSLKGQTVQALIGRDVLKAGRFTYEGHSNMYLLTFTDA